MKRNFFIILTILLIISAIVGCTVYNYRQTQANIAQYNKQYESWYNKPILGTDFISIINKTIDNNEKNDIQKDENSVNADCSYITHTQKQLTGENSCDIMLSRRKKAGRNRIR